MNLGEYFALLTSRKPITNLCAFVTSMQLYFPSHLQFLLPHMKCWHGSPLKKTGSWVLTDKTHLPTQPLQIKLSIFNSIKWPELGSKDLCYNAVTIHFPFPLFPTRATFWKKRFTNIQLWLDHYVEKTNSSTTLVLNVERRRKWNTNWKMKFYQNK